MLTRRNLMTAAVLGGFTALIPARLWALTSLTIGDGRIDVLSDGHLEVRADFGSDTAPDPAAGTNNAPCNIALWSHGGRRIMFDAGSGHDFMPTAGKVVDALAALDLAPEDVTHVVFTHGHPDHFWGVLDDFDEPAFPNAELLMGRIEHDYWLDPATVEQIGEARQSFVAGASRRLSLLGDRLKLFEDGDQLFPEVVARLTPGHTPGHMNFVVGPARDQIMVLGDAITNATTNFTDPLDFSESDQDQPMAAQTRAALLAELADLNMPFVGFHLPGGGIGRAAQHGAAYRFFPGE